jgi:hypothetical protein
MSQFPPSPRVFHLDRFEFFRKLAEIFTSLGAPPVSATTVENFSTIFASVVDTGGIFATGVNYAGGKLPPVSMTPGRGWYTADYRGSAASNKDFNSRIPGSGEHDNG